MGTLPRFLSPEPEVRLVNAFSEPFKNVVSTARTCYSSKGIIAVEELSERDKEISRSIYKAGHHTTLQHGHFQFTLNHVSRQFIWSFLHSHPFYNSEQVSQRYVAVKPESYVVPALAGQALDIYLETVRRQTDAYYELGEKLIPLVASQYQARFPGRKLTDRGPQRDVKKKAQEVARYVLPVATMSYLYHTLSGITLLRYWRLCRQFDCPLEQQVVVGKMIEQLLEFDPNFRLILEDPLSIEETPEYEHFHALTVPARRQVRSGLLEEFDGELEDRVSRLVDWKINNEKVLAQSVREVLGLPATLLSDEEAIALVLSPVRNRLFGESLNVTTLSKLTRCLVHVHYTFRKKLSHTADSQDQRHRMTPGSRPILAAHFTGDPDYVTPGLVRQDPAVEADYCRIMNYSWEQINRLRELGVSEEFAFYLLPNATSIRFTESGDLLNLHHKYALRLCYNAQDEIWRASLDEVQQIMEVNPLIGKYLLPPCTLRHMAKVRPICPEGERYCGVPVWKLDLSDYRRVI